VAHGEVGEQMRVGLQFADETLAFAAGVQAAGDVVGRRAEQDVPQPNAIRRMEA